MLVFNLGKRRNNAASDYPTVPQIILQYMAVPGRFNLQRVHQRNLTTWVSALIQPGYDQTSAKFGYK